MLNGLRDLFENIRRYRELITFKNFDKMYDEAEYDKLLHKLTPTNIIFCILSISVCAKSGEKSITNVTYSRDRKRKFKYMSEYFYEEEPLIFKMMFKRSLKEMPLHINHPRGSIRIIALWRLSINK